MTGKDRATVNHHIFTRNTATASVGILATLDTDTIITGIEARIDNQCILTRLQVERIAILCIAGIAHQHLVDNHILAHQRMEVPSGRVLEDESLEHDILTLHKRYHHRAQETLDGIPLLFGLSVRHVHVGTLLALSISGRRHPIVFLQLL